MPRIQPLTPPYEDAVQETFDRLMPPGMDALALFRTMAHNPRVLRRLQRGGLLDPGSITVRQRELAILRTCYQCGAEYEWGVHATAFGAAAGLTDEELAATTVADASACFNDDERLVLRLCDTLHARATINDALHAELSAAFNAAQLIELTMLVGLYHAVSFMVNVSQVEPEPWARTWGASPGPKEPTTPAPVSADG